VFTNLTKEDSELDFTTKISGETITEITTNAKHLNNGNKPHTIGCKVVRRIVCKVSKVFDTCHMEAAAASAGSFKICSDKFKLAVESKCAIDDLVSSGEGSQTCIITIPSLLTNTWIKSRSRIMDFT
jgi:hypothetical protein